MEALLNQIARNQRKQEWVEFNSDLFNEILGSYKYIDSGRARVDFCLIEELYFKLKEIVESKTNTRIRVYDNGCTIVCDGRRIDGLTRMEKRLLSVLVLHDGVLERERLIDEVFQNSDTSLGNLANLKSKVNNALDRAGFPFWVEIESGVGYRIAFRKPVTAPAD
ncbi:MAG: helix-turn-helix domain-containing protein [Thermoguttaceae bacterium]|nr:helix-turn-helix domain-containing protein [Thermoguttaceae bacterium]